MAYTKKSTNGKKKNPPHVRVSEETKYRTQHLKRDTDALHHYLRGEIRVLTPSEYHKLREAIPKDRHKTILDILLITGMRYVEVQRLWENRIWYNEKKNIIHLPEGAQKKDKRTQLERTIHPLPGMFNYLAKDFFESQRPPAETNWNRNLREWAKKAGINPYGFSAKMTRKTIESWMVKAGIVESTICLRQGHDNLTSMRHYQGLAFSDDEINDIRKQLTTWGILK